MKKIFGLIFALTLAVLASAPRTSPASVQCTACSGSFNTAPHTGTGMTCQGAKDKINGMATDLGDACTGPNDIPCNPVLVIDVKCFTNAQGKKEVTGHYVYSCATCVDVPGGGNN